MRQTASSRWTGRPARAAALIATSVLLAMCHKDSTAPREAVASVTVAGAQAGATLAVGQSVQLTAAVRGAAGSTLTDRTVSWTSSNAAVASVAASGLLTAVGPGTTTVTATVEAVTGSVDLSVGAPITVPGAGATQPATSTLIGGNVVVVVPPGAVAAGTTLTVGPAATSSLPSTTRVVNGAAYVFGPAGVSFASPLTLTLKYDATGISAADKAGLGIYVANGANWDPVPGSAVSGTDNSVSAPITHFSVYAVLKHADPAAVAASAGNGQSANVGSAVATAPSVLVSDALGRPVPGVTVTFAVASGGGTITGATPVTNASGIATVGSWTLGAVAGSNTLTATVSGLPAVTFTATAIAIPPVIKFGTTSATFNYVAGNAPPASQAVAITNAGGLPITDLSVGGIAYSGAASGWLTASLSAQTTPSTLTLSATPTSVGIGVYTATVSLQAPASGAAAQSMQVTLNVSASAARQLAITTQPSGSRAGAVIDVQPVVEIRDGAGQLVTNATAPITVSLVADSGTLGGTTTLNAVGGVARWQDLVISHAHGYGQLVFQSGSLLPATSSTFWIGTGVPTAVSIQGGDQQTAPAGSMLPQPLSVRVRDVDGFGVPGVTVVWAVMSGGGSLSVTASMTDANGIATTLWTLGAVGSQQVSATVSGAGAAATFTATATPTLFQFRN